MNVLTPVAVRVGRLSWLPKYQRYIVATDKAVHRLTRGRYGVLAVAGLPQLMLTVRGRKSGVPRTTPLLCVPHDGSFLVAGSNWGEPKLPVWVLNLRADPEPRISYRGRDMPVTVRETAGEERERLWRVMNRTWPNYDKYAERTDRVIPVFVLTPI
ncbi:MAG TPA: nitroreductase family deazaflavin-dependent oxidoreductase [Nocardioidaceae bacterium]|nr:nitroreductase family deazaflavin-dependent oxidoreductase [Nocardioidaceae bacterium]